MANPSFQIDYNHDLQPLAQLLSDVKRPGDFYASGVLTVPMPRLDIAGVGTISFPVPEFQAQQIIQKAVLAPYGKGEETLIDTSVRKVWQIAPEEIRLSGAAWSETFDAILSRVLEGLGCGNTPVVAELYKVLLYDKGGFFTAHRDTEKAEGMFGTLVIVLPSFHRGGDLIIQHAGREATINLAPEDVSQLTFAAFYADCLHEVRPVEEGNRLCLIYNLIQRSDGKRRKPLTAPDYAAEIAGATELLAKWMARPDAPPKVVYLLEHEYSPAGLSFSGLKNADAALAAVLRKAARRAGATMHLGIVHIEENGPAEIDYDPRSYRSRWGRYDEDNEDEDFEIVEINESYQYISGWVDLNDQPVQFREIPLKPGEMLPAGALDGEKPDEQRVMEATGNEGASFERSYHRAAIVLWSEQRYAEVLLQAGAEAALPYLKQQIAAAPSRDAGVAALATRIVDAWEPSDPYSRDDSETSTRAEMLDLLETIGNAGLAAKFIQQIVATCYDGREKEQLAACARSLNSQAMRDALSAVIQGNMATRHRSCVDLLQRLADDAARTDDAGLRTACKKLAAIAVQALPTIGAPSTLSWWEEERPKLMDAATVADLIDVLRQLGARNLEKEAVNSLIAHPHPYAPDSVVAPALSLLHSRHGDAAADTPFIDLWKHAAEFLLARSETRPSEPVDWAQPVTLKCRCVDCRELQKFARNPEQQVHRFQVRQDRRQHLQHTIKTARMDMDCQTDLRGRPQTLVCTKTWASFQRRCQEYASDIGHLKMLIALAESFSGKVRALFQRARTAVKGAKG